LSKSVESLARGGGDDRVKAHDAQVFVGYHGHEGFVFDEQDLGRAVAVLAHARTPYTPIT